MVDTGKDEKKKPIFEKVDDGIIFRSDDGTVTAYGLPTEIETKIAGKGKGSLSLKGGEGEVGGEHYKKVAYEWYFEADRDLTPREVSEYSDSVAYASGTYSCQSHTVQIEESYIFCQCGYAYDSNDSFAIYCAGCGVKH